MRTDVISFVLGSENRKKIVKTIFEYPKRQWSCSALEDLTKISHATVFRALNGLRDFGILKSIRINKKDLIFDLVRDSPLTKELKRIISIDRTTIRKIVNNLINKIKSKHMRSAVLYGSSIKGNIKPESDIDILVILDKHNTAFEKKVFDVTAELSSKINRTISATIMNLQEIKKEQNSQFIKSVKSNMEVIYGKKPF